MWVRLLRRLLPGTNQRGIATDQGGSVKDLLLAGIGDLHVEDDKMIIVLSVPFKALQTIFPWNVIDNIMISGNLRGMTAWYVMIFEGLSGLAGCVLESNPSALSSAVSLYKSPSRSVIVFRCFSLQPSACRNAQTTTCTSQVTRLLLL